MPREDKKRPCSIPPQACQERYILKRGGHDFIVPLHYEGTMKAILRLDYKTVSADNLSFYVQR